MSKLFQTRVSVHDWTFYILTRGLCLTLLFLLGAVALHLGSSAWLAVQYANHLFTMGGVLLAVSLIGPLLVEDILRKT